MEDKTILYYEEFTCNALDVINFNIVKGHDEIEEVNNFKPTMAHQFFGENEKILGYKGLRIDFHLSPATLTPCLTYKYDEKMGDDEDIKADDIESVLIEKLPSCYKSLAYFQNAVQDDGKECFGKMVKQYKIEDDEGFYEIYQVTGEDLVTEKFQRFNEHLQYLLLFFIDASSFIDSTDPDWEYLLLYRQSINQMNQEKCYELVGYLTLHNFYSYPNKIRQRISQIFILPPFQRKGHGEALLRTTYELAISNDQVKDVTVEDASDEFQRLRDFVDCSNVLQLSDYNKDMVQKQLLKKFTALLKSKLKLNHKQITRVFEIIGLMSINRSNPVEGMKYQQMVIKRLMGICANMEEVNHNSAKLALATIMEDRASKFEREYERLEQCYNEVITKLKNHI